VLRIEGYSGGERFVFRGDVDYVLNAHKIEWISLDSASKKPDDLSDFIVTYTYGSSLSNLTDVNVGSVLRILVESIGRELELLHSELRYIYDSGFIDTARGKSLDLVVSMVGIKRKPPTYANGFVTFIKESDPPELVSNEVLIYDGREYYELRNTPVKAITKVRFNEEGEERILVEGDDYQLENNSIKFLVGPKLGGELRVDYVSYQRIMIPGGTIVSTYAKQSQDIINFETKADSEMTLNEVGYWEADVEMSASSAGSKGNVLAGSIIVMPKPPLGVDKVINRAAMGGGSDEESDESLRDRAKKVLDVKGKATIESLRTALEGVDGIQSTPLIIDMPDGIPGIVKAVVDGGDEIEISRVIEDTRAAGIVVEFERPKLVVLDIELSVIVRKSASSGQHAKVVLEAEKNVRDYMSTLKIGDNVITNKIVSILLEITSVRDVADLVITAYRLPPQVEKLTDREKKIAVGLDEAIESEEEAEPVADDLSESTERKDLARKSVFKSRENIEISPNERAYLRDIKISIGESK
jgi:uncharacterized phage protein gp47/JayE